MKGKKWIALAMVAAMALSGAGLAAFAQGEEGAASPSETVAPIEEVVYVATYFDFDGELLASYAVPAGAVLEEAIFVQIQGGEFLGWYPCDETGAWMGDAPFIFGEPMTGDVFVRACAPGEGLAQPTESASPAGTQSADELSNAFDMQPTQQPMEPQSMDELNAIFDALLAGSAQSAGQPTEPQPVEGAQPTEQPAEPARKVTILVSRDTEELQLGSQITLTAVLEGYEGVPYTCVWQYATADRDGNIVGEWQDAQTDVLSLSYTLTEDNLLTAWRLRVVAADVGLPAIE